jgi:hypothetical protein
MAVALSNQSTKSGLLGEINKALTDDELVGAFFIEKEPTNYCF